MLPRHCKYKGSIKFGGYQDILDPKNLERKINKAHKDFKPSVPLYIFLTRRIDIFWSRDIDKF